MSVDKLNEDKLDEMLRRTLQASPQPSPADFTERILKQVRAAEERQILTKVVWQERLRLALASCIAAVIAAIATAVIFTVIKGGFTPAVQLFIYNTGLSIKGFSSQWQLYIVFAGVFAFTGYSIINLLVSD
jgi:hypothetical protein